MEQVVEKKRAPNPACRRFATLYRSAIWLCRKGELGWRKLSGWRLTRRAVRQRMPLDMPIAEKRNGDDFRKTYVEGLRVSVCLPTLAAKGG